jgi:lipopolysaccharide transport system permease protein
MGVNREQTRWREILTPDNKVFSIPFREIWDYRDLLFIFIRRDILAIYKQTILGPLWFFLQPVLATMVYVLVFSRVAKMSTGNIPPALFYLSGLVLWSYFAECVTRTSTFIRDNTSILSKVYFPRLVIPISLVLTNLVRFAIQLVLFFLVYAWFIFNGSIPGPNIYALTFPLLVLMIALLGLGIGMIVSSLTTRYKDLAHLLVFGVQLLMFASPVIFPLSNFSNGNLAMFIKANPMTGIIEAFRHAFFGEGIFSWQLLTYDAGCILLFLLLGIFLFNRVEKSFVDTI